MYVFRMREYKTPAGNPNCPDHKIEATTEWHAERFAHIEADWIYFYVDLESPQDL